MNTIRLFLLLFIVFSVFIVSRILEYSPQKDVLSGSDMHSVYEFSEVIPPDAAVTYRTHDRIEYTSGMSIAQLHAWYKRKYKQLEIASAYDGENKSLTLTIPQEKNSYIIIKLDQNGSTPGTTGIIFVKPS